MVKRMQGFSWAVLWAVLIAPAWGQVVNPQFLQEGAGASARTFLSKARESVSVKDFGATGNCTTDDTAAIQSAMNASLRVHFPKTSDCYKITDSITIDVRHVITGDSAASTRIVMTDATKWAFKADAVADTSGAFNGSEARGGSFSDIDLRARYGLRINAANIANSPSFDYADFAAFYAAAVPVAQFIVERCIFIPDAVYGDAYAYIAASPNWNTATVPTVADLYARGVAVLFANNYRGVVRDSEIKFYGIGVWLFGADLAEVSHNRIANNLRHVHIQTQQTGGFQSKISKNDLLANYRYGGVYVSGAHARIQDNYFENSGESTNSTINYYIVDEGQTTAIIANRMDDYGSTKTSGGLIVFAGVGGAIVDQNVAADNRPSGAGNRNTITVSASNWNPATAGLDNAWGLVLMGNNDNSLPRIRHPLIAYGLDGNELEWSPLARNRDLGFYDVSAGGVMSSFKYATDAAGLWYLNPSPFSNGIILKPRQDQLTKTLNYTVTIRARSIDASAPYTVFWVIKWVTAAGVASDLYTGSKTYSTNTDIEEYSQSVTIPAATQGYFVVYVAETDADLYGIRIVEQ